MITGFALSFAGYKKSVGYSSTCNIKQKKRYTHQIIIPSHNFNKSCKAKSVPH